MSRSLDFGIRPRGLAIQEDVNQERSSIQSVASMISSTAQVDNLENYSMLPLNLLDPFYKHAFKLRPMNELMEMAESLKTMGLLVPVIVRPKGKRYEILAGHNRVEAAKLAGWMEIQVKVMNVDDDMAALIMTDTNLQQREKLSYSEKARAYQMQMEIYKRQGMRTDLVGGIDCTDEEEDALCPDGRWDATRIIANKYKENRRNIYRCIRLNYLIPSLLNLVDNAFIPFRAAVELSYLNEENQNTLFSILSEQAPEGQKKIIDLSKAEQLRRMESNETQISAASMQAVLFPAKDIDWLVKTSRKVSKSIGNYIKQQTVGIDGADPEELSRELEQALMNTARQYFDDFSARQ